MPADYKDSGAQWIGRVPIGWEVKPAFSVFDEIGERNDLGQVRNVLSLSYGKVVPRDVESNFGLLPQSFNTYHIVQAGDVVLRLLDLQNDHVSLRVGLVPEEGIVTSAYLSVRPKGGLDSRFAAYLLHAYDLNKVFYSFGGGCRQSMGFEDLRRLPIPFPSPAEQGWIAAYLDEATGKVDRLVALRRRQMELLREKQAALIDQTITRGLNPRTALRSVNLGWVDQIPKHWRTSKLRRVTSSIGDGLHGTPLYVDESPHHFINGNNLVNGAIRIFPNTRCVSEAEYRRLSSPLGDRTLLMSINGTLGNVALFQGEPVVLGKSAAYINCSKELDRTFLMYVTQSASAAHFLHQEATGTTILNLSLEAIRNFRIVLPPLDEQLEIAACIQREMVKLDKLHRSYERQLELLMEYRASLIHECVTGQRAIPKHLCPSTATN